MFYLLGIGGDGKEAQAAYVIIGMLPNSGFDGGAAEVGTQRFDSGHNYSYVLSFSRNRSVISLVRDVMW